uniref:Uncharacterized protein n=1 Tax=Rhizophora mucronata TaxID=61149 RepID=A0A2P2P755_RHIMU
MCSKSQGEGNQQENKQGDNQPTTLHSNPCRNQIKTSLHVTRKKMHPMSNFVYEFQERRKKNYVGYYTEQPT